MLYRKCVMIFHWKSIKIPVFILLAFGLWCFSFWGFLINQLSLQGDAIAYSEHFYYFINNLSRGVYPLWEPTRDGGVPTEFFLRRIGEFNPLYLIILILYKIGVPYFQSYLIFLALYYFLGMIGFYKLAKEVTKNKTASLVAYLLLMFSSLGTNLFSSFILLIFVPMVWFFYFFIAFNRSPKKYLLLGLTVTLMIILTTYIPFYFVTIFGIFCLCAAGIYFRDLKGLFMRYVQFLNGHKMISGVCFVALCLALIPGIMFQQESKRGEFVLPIRNISSLSGNALDVKHQTLGGGGVVHSEAQGFLTGLKSVELGDFYIPIFTYVILLCGLFVKVNKQMVVLGLSGLLIYLISLNDATVFYKFLYEHIFYFKYFRNFFFFLWVFLLPAGILLLAEQFRLCLKWKIMSKQNVMPLLFIFIIIHPMIVYHHLQNNSTKGNGPYRYRQELQGGKLPYLDLTLPKKVIINKTSENVKSKASNDMYFGTKWFHILRQKLDSDLLEKYLANKILIYNYQPKNFEYPISQDQITTQDSKNIQITRFDVNSLTLQTNLFDKKFLIYNDNYYTGWQAFVDGEQVDLFRTNEAFKGVWVPAGKHVIHFRYGTTGQYFIKYLMLGVFNIMFWYLIWTSAAAFRLREIS
ncbi:hypothetical protein MNBD_UNCLBAC01-268 [hydrothermal vent metagenome]|uniref:YfhO family protein n=1 Tax=hydrothermal vent metagenome TaxID=652676 RepID=A0A3B1D866_9ZZZZ